MKRIPLLLLSMVAFAASAAPPEACSLLAVEEINAIAERPVEKAQLQKTGNPSQCAFLDARKAAVIVISVREVQYAVRDEMHYQRENDEKIYRMKSKPQDTVGEGGYWLPANKQLTFRKGKLIVTLTFSTPKNQNELDTAQLARLAENRLPK